jgi:hypothetical protein
MSTDFETWVVDRFEADLAVIVSDSGAGAEVARAQLPPGCEVGTVLRVRRRADEVIHWAEATVDEEATRERRAEAEAILEELRERDPGGDIAM